MNWIALQVAASTDAVAVAQDGPCMVCWGGLGQVTETMAAQLTDLRLSTAVTAVHHTASGVSVHTSTGDFANLPVAPGNTALLQKQHASDCHQGDC